MSADLELWQRHDELAAALAKRGVLADDRFGEIPGEQQQVIRLALGERLGCDDRNMQPRRIKPLFPGTVINDELDLGRANAEMVHQRGRLRGRSVSCNAPLLTLQVLEQAAE